MTFQHIAKHSSGDILTGRLWRKDHLNDLPFYSSIPRMDYMEGPLLRAFGEGNREGCYGTLLVKLGKGLDEVYPFSDTPAVDVVFRQVDAMFSGNIDAVGRKYASRIWGYVSKFVMLDRFCKTLGVAGVYPATPVHRKICTLNHFGTAARVLDELNPPTKVIGKFLKTWRVRKEARAEYSHTATTPSTVDGGGVAGVALTLSKRLIAVVKVKDVLHIETGLEMIALVMAISSENNGVFPELASDVKTVLRRIWSNVMDPQQLEDISNDIQNLHKPLKNMIEIVFAASPILALSTHGWNLGYNSVYLLKIFNVLGNERPGILVKIEDCILEAIIALSEGQLRENAINDLYSKILVLEHDLCKDESALTWFNFPTSSRIPSTPPLSGLPVTPSSGFPNLHTDMIQGALLSPPESNHYSPIVPDELPSVFQEGKHSPHQFANPRDISTPFLDDTLNQKDGGLGGVEPDSTRRSSQSSLSLLSGILENEEGTEIRLTDEFNNPDLVFSDDEENDDPMIGVDCPMHLWEGAKKTERMNVVKSSSDDNRGISEDADGQLDDTRKKALMIGVESKDVISPPVVDRDENHAMIGVESEESSSNSLKDKKGEPMAGVESLEPFSGPLVDVEDGHKECDGVESLTLKLSDSSYVGGEGVSSSNLSHNASDAGSVVGSMTGIEVTQTSVESDLLASIGELCELRRSRRKADEKIKETEKVHPSRPLSSGTKKPPTKKTIFLQDELDDESAKLSDVGKAAYHTTLYADIAGWGSTIDAGPKSYRHIPVQIPGNPETTGGDTETLRKLEQSIQADFKNGLPPHLQPNARNTTYGPSSDQSRIFVASHSDFNSLRDVDVQRILRERLILVHGNPFDYSYGWDLASFGRLYDVDKKTTIQVSTKGDPHNPSLRKHQGTLRELHKFTIGPLGEECPPLNALSLPAHRRNLVIPCQFGSLASHEVAQSRVPSSYEHRFQVPDIKSDMEWSLVGSKGTISQFHVDAEGMGTAIVVLEGSKYWILATKFGEDENISSVDSLGPSWHAYSINEGENVDRFRFEAVHLQKGDMLIMPPGVPHWVLGTSNAICAGRFFYSSSTIRSSVVTIVHTFLLGAFVTNDYHVKTRTFLYQLIVFWSIRIDETDVDGAHIPDLSSDEGFYDVLYLGIFVILSPAFDRRFYLGTKPPPAILDEVAFAVAHFHALLLLFSSRFIILLEGEVVTHSYIVDRMLGEFAAAAVVFSKGVKESNGLGNIDQEVDDMISMSKFADRIHGILQESHPNVLSYYLRCLRRRHKHFLWTGPKIKILRRTNDTECIMPFIITGELRDHPVQSIYPINVDDSPLPSPPTVLPVVGKRYDREDDMNLSGEHPNKRKC